jgi:hypothetical protein
MNFFKWNIFVTNFFKIFFFKKVQETFFGGGHHHIYPYWLQLKEFLEIMSLVKLKST